MDPSQTSRVPLISRRDQLNPDALAVFDRIVESRGSIVRPFEVLLHSPVLADQVAALGHVVRSGMRLSEHDRELATLAAGRALGCDFVWESHLDAARAAGIEAATTATLESGGDLMGREGTLVTFVRELCGTGRVSDETFHATQDVLDAQRVVELALMVGYYAMLGCVMGAVEAC